MCIRDSISLVLQTVLPVCFQARNPIKVVVKGGTDVKWSPPIDYIKNVTLPLLEKMGFKAELSLERRGYYPTGGGIVKAVTYPSNPQPIELVEKGKLLSVEGVSHSSSDLKKAEVAERQARAARKIIYDSLGVEPKIKVEYCGTTCPGSGIQLWIKTRNTVIGGNALGEKGKKAEDVGKEAALSLLGQFKKGVVDRWSADQLIPYMALAGKSRIVASEISNHCETNMKIVELFTGKRFIVKNNIIKVE